jgi:hypothetical protein
VEMMEILGEYQNTGKIDTYVHVQVNL